MIDQFKAKTIVVIGDVMLDKYLHGTVERVSPEAPVQVLRYTKSSCVPGGAANVANNIVSLGAKAILCGVVGSDENKELLFEKLKLANIDTSGLFVDETRPTIVKQRVMSGNYQLLRIDYEKTEHISEELEQKVLDFVKSSITKVDGIVVSDYAKGMLSERLVREIVKLAKLRKKPIVGDMKPKNADFFRDFDLLAPNVKEAGVIAKIKGSNAETVQRMGRYLVAKLHSNIFITRGANGISVFEKNGSFEHIPTRKIQVFDVSGAGDTVVAVSALAMACGMNLFDTARLANKAGGLVVQKPGTSTLTIDELKSIYREDISEFLKEGIEIKQRVMQTQTDKIDMIAKIFIEAYKNHHKVLAFGNGGSATDAQHLVGEIVGRFKNERKAFPAMALTCDSAVVTAIANDYGYDKIFERQVEAAVQPGDVVVGITTSGKSPNVINGLRCAKELGAKTIGLTGKDGGLMPGVCDVCLIVPSDNTPRIQETHMVLIHIICELLDNEFVKK